MTTTTIECRQHDSNQVRSNGDYNTTIQQKLSLEEGDSLYLRNVFVDTQAQSAEKIVIEDGGLDLFIENYRYQVDWDEDHKLDESGNNPRAEATYGLFVECKKVNTGGGNLGFIENLEVALVDDTSIKYGGGYVDIDYTDPDDNVKTKRISIPEYNLDKDGRTNYLSINIYFKDGTTPRITSHHTQRAGFALVTTTIQDAVFHPVVTTQQIFLPGGIYSADDLTVFLNREMTANRTDGSNLSTNPYLKPSDSTLFYVNVDGEGTDIYKTTPTHPYWIGSNQMELSFIPQSQQFAWKQIHMPYFVSGDAVVQYIPVGTPTDYKVVGRNGGVMFHDLRAQSHTTKEPVGFWDDLLGFDLKHDSPDTILAINSPVSHVAGVQLPKFDTKVGKRTTSAFEGIDSLLQDKETPSAWPFVPTGNDRPNPTTSTDTSPIIGGTGGVLSKNENGYFLIEVQSNFQNDFVTPSQNMNTVQAILSRYYSVGSFTSGTAEDSIVYTHRGAPLVLSSFNIRILNPEKEVATGIGTDNSVYITLVKAEPKTS